MCCMLEISKVSTENRLRLYYVNCSDVNKKLSAFSSNVAKNMCEF
jgi:hypothetical protein